MLLDKEDKLDLLKRNLQTNTTANDEYLNALLDQATALMKRRGIIEEDSMDYHMAQIDYAAFLFRKRANLEAPFPEHLKQELRDILFSQKMK